MKSCNKLIAEMRAMSQGMLKMKKSKRTGAFKTVKPVCSAFNVTAGMLKGARTEGFRSSE
jgi:hypothetical protein